MSLKCRANVDFAYPRGVAMNCEPGKRTLPWAQRLAELRQQRPRTLRGWDYPNVTNTTAHIVVHPWVHHVDMICLLILLGMYATIWHRIYAERCLQKAAESLKPSSCQSELEAKKTSAVPVQRTVWCQALCSLLAMQRRQQMLWRCAIRLCDTWFLERYVQYDAIAMVLNTYPVTKHVIIHNMMYKYIYI